MKKLISALLIVSLICSTYREAEAIAIPVAAVVVGSALLLTAAGTAYYSNPSTSAAASAAVSTAGNYYRAVDAYTSGVTAYGKQQIYKDVATLKVSGQALIDAVKNAADGTYSALKDLLTNDPSTIPPDSLPSAGDVVTASNGFNYALSGGYALFASNALQDVERLGVQFYSSGYVYYSYYVRETYPVNPSACIANVYRAPVSSTTLPSTYLPPVSPVVTPADLPSRLSPGGSIPADVADEMDDLIKNNPSIATPTAGATATGTAALDDSGSQVPPYVPVLPDGVSTTPPDTVTGLGAQTLADAQARLAAAQQALAEAQAAAAADPASLPLQQVVTTAQTAVANATQAVSNADEKASESYNTPQKPPLRLFDFSKWTQLLNIMSNVWPFTLLLTLSDYFNLLVTEPVAPVFSLHIYQDKQLSIDLSMFDTIALITRWIIGLLLSFGSVQLLLKWWRGVS